MGRKQEARARMLEHRTTRLEPRSDRNKDDSARSNLDTIGLTLELSKTSYHYTNPSNCISRLTRPTGRRIVAVNVALTLSMEAEKESRVGS